MTKGTTSSGIAYQPRDIYAAAARMLQHINGNFTIG